MRIQFFSLLEIKEVLKVNKVIEVNESKHYEALRSEATKTELEIIAEKIKYLIAS